MNKQKSETKNDGFDMYQNRWKYYLQFAGINIFFIIVLGGGGWYLDKILQMKPILMIAGLMLSFILSQIIFIYKMKKKS